LWLRFWLRFWLRRLPLFVAGDGVGGKGVSIIALQPRVKAGDKPKEAWRLITGIPYVPCLLPYGKHIFFVTDAGVAVCILAATGKEVWRETLGVGAFYGSPVLVGEHIYIISKRGEVVAFTAADKFKPLGVSPLGEGSFASPAIAGGRMYLRTFSSLIAVGKK
jgi:outer membrane protein assembly factor BamB